MNHLVRHCALLVTAALLGGCTTPPPRPGTRVARTGDEMVVAGQFFHTGTPVVLWMDPGGYDAYRVERRFAPFDQSSWETSHVAVAELKTPNRYGLRKAAALTGEQIERVRGGGWDLPLLQEVVDQFVIHFDVAGTSRQCFKVLHDARDLSVHFMLDLDGTLYQTLDVKERAWHATSSNTRSVGIEIANVGAYPSSEADAFQRWYENDTNGTRIKIPSELGDGGIRMPGFVGHPARPEPVAGEVQGQSLVQYDFTPEQYRALTHLTAALCKVFPKLRCDFPRDAEGKLAREKLPDEELERYQGVLGHYHVQRNKVDPGPAFQWERVIDGARELMADRPQAEHGAQLLQPQKR
jgi:N-acetylmuramoyl-L-alanine amidase